MALIVASGIHLNAQQPARQRPEPADQAKLNATIDAHMRGYQYLIEMTGVKN